MSGESSSSTSAMEEPDVTHCSICLETFKEPKALPCLHTFCRTCLEQHCADKALRKAQKVSCPMCREPFAIPRGGVTNLRNNFFIDQLIQLKQTQDVAQKKHPSNNNFRELQVSHPVVPRYNEAYMQHSKKKMKLSVNYCGKHPGEPNRLYCNDCKMLTCHLCFVSKHMKHNLTDVNEAAEIFRQQLKRDVDNISAYSLEKLEKIKQLDYEANRFMEKIATTESEISQKCDQLISLIQYHKNEMMEELNVFKNKILIEVETMKDEIKTQSVIRDSFSAYVHELMNTGTACDISRTVHDLHARAEELVKTRDESDCPKLSKVEITFKPSLSSTDSVKNFIGELVLRVCYTEAGCSKKSQKFDFTKLLGSITVRHVMPEAMVAGITVLGSEIFVVRCTSLVNVCKSDDFTFVPNLTITGSKDLVGLVSCSHYNCLYAIDWRQKIIYRYDVTKIIITNWAVSGTCYRLSVTKRYSILATLYDAKRIQEYTTHGSLIREISLDSSMDRPWHNIQLSTGNYVVCLVGTQHRVCIVDQSGCIIQSYGGPPGSGVGQLNYPRHLAVDVHDNVLVADHGNNRVQLLNPTMTYLGDIVIPGHQLNRPYTLHFDELKHRLYIGEWTGGRMCVLNVNYD